MDDSQSGSETTTTTRTTWRIKKYSFAASTSTSTSSLSHVPPPPPLPSSSSHSSSNATRQPLCSTYSLPASNHHLAEYTRPSPASSDKSVLEWTHHVAPVLSLQFETTTSIARATPSSAQLQVIYEPVHSNHRIVFESIELPSFSSSHIRARCPTTELPLKAIYQGSAVGIRYFSSELDRYKRFQVMFERDADAVRFLESTRQWIPAKPSEKPSAPNPSLHLRSPARIEPVHLSPAGSQATSNLERSSFHTARTGLDRVLPNLRGAILSNPDGEALGGARSPFRTQVEVLTATDLARLDDAQMMGLIERVVEEDRFDELVEKVKVAVDQILQ